MFKLILESGLEDEIQEEFRAAKCQRSTARKGYSNGYYERSSTLDSVLLNHQEFPELIRLRLADIALLSAKAERN